MVSSLEGGGGASSAIAVFGKSWSREGRGLTTVSRDLLC